MGWASGFLKIKDMYLIWDLICLTFTVVTFNVCYDYFTKHVKGLSLCSLVKTETIILLESEQPRAKQAI